VLLGVRMS
jgi:Glutathionylspermidine synthase